METLHTATKLIPLMVRLPPEVHTALRRVGEEERRSMNSQLIILLEEALTARNAPKHRR